MQPTVSILVCTRESGCKKKDYVFSRDHGGGERKDPREEIKRERAMFLLDGKKKVNIGHGCLR